MFYERLNYLCQKNGTNISKVSQEFLGVSNSTATGWKKGAAPRSDIVIKAAQHFGVTSDFLLGLDSAQEDGETITLSDTEASIIEDLRQAPPEAQTAAIAAMRSVLMSLRTQGNGSTKRAVYYRSDHDDDAERKGAV